ncbi:MAG TPA: sensor domain-containing diguanylate cyclase [Spirochaetota bacterium]|nr:sensor domain-containing diguanylate cyclase [Spirochaetota bacterium]HPQ53308.1 sensor domain-containing diguanylate cyclase [Spirochaetota bacterium]
MNNQDIIHTQDGLSGEREESEETINALERKIYELRNLIEMGMSLSSNLEFQSLVESILYSCIGQMFVEKVAIILQEDIDKDNYSIHMSKGYDEEFSRSEIVFDENSALIHYLEKEAFPQLCGNLREHSELVRDLDSIAMLDAEIVVPLVSKSSMNGLLVLGKKIDGSTFTRDDIEFLRDLARFAAITVENSRLYLMATLDRMTHLYIHHFFQERLNEELKRSVRYGTPLSLIITDIDHFKRFNDTYGHQQGDMVLKETAQILRESVRGFDIPARYGGEEFAVILPETDLENAVVVAKRLRKRIEQHAFRGQAEALHVTISVGVAQYDPRRDKGKEHLIGRADRAMYRAKESGRNRVVVIK